SNSQKVALFAVPILAKIEVITKPFLYPILKILDIFFNKDEESKVYPTLSKDEVKALISEADKEGVFDKDISGMLERSVWFAETSVIKVMTPFSDIESVNINEEEEKFIDMVIETSRSRVPVYEDKKTNIIGYIHINDILWIWKENNGKFSKSCIKPAFFIDQDKKISELLKELQSGRTHIAFVKDRKDNILGMVTLEDIVEEIVGEILDEYEL
ncbi:MAG: CBS domain-containing protein, partial [Endomicrobiia bacterium]